MGISEGRHPLSRLGDRHYHSMGDHVVKGADNLLLVLYWYLSYGMLEQGYARVGPDGIGSGHVADCVKQAGEGVCEWQLCPRPPH